MPDPSLPQRAAYLGDAPPPAYWVLNPHLPAPAAPPDPATRRVLRAPGQVEATWFQRHGTSEGLAQQVKVVPLPVCLTAAQSRGILAEMAMLREQGHLTALRGRRRTDLARPLRPAVRDTVRRQCPHLVAFLQRLEPTIQGSELFIRAIKLDEARRSTTQTGARRDLPNLHFDAEKSSLAQYGEPLYQFYANIARLPRQFRILPVPLPAMLARLQAEGHLAGAAPRELPLEAILARYLAHYPLVEETIVIESGQLAIFDGRTFAHDAGKGQMRALQQGRFLPSHEPDLVIAFDTVATGYHVGYYDPARPFLDDPGTPAWWALMDQVAP